ncbi:hypothetical protein KOW79_017830 [Hemibagrus wyckioides]|uniref:CTCK domain-containing protein n=1 Tax=Hemibagrus wyckioides TaxID=337641 RepID=A0A9D3SCF5_9TELE|nr:hypothetical protein KOW79_017830 [Hemibagrus wyckioides]
MERKLVDTDQLGFLKFLPLNNLIQTVFLDFRENLGSGIQTWETSPSPRGWSGASTVSRTRSCGSVRLGAAMLLIGCVLLAVCSAAPPAHINRLALFPDKSAWCEAKNITQIVGHTGCVSQSIQNRACLGQCFSYSVPNTFPQSTESLVHCDSCMPAQTQWEVVTLECPGSVETPRVEKLVERILHCSCQSCECDGEAWGSRRGRGVCVLCGLMLALWNAGVGVACVTLLCVVFTLVLTPPTLLLYTGFLCHTRVLASPSPLCSYLDDNSCSALIILGFVMMSPLVVVAAATFCSLLRRFHILQLFQPISTAQYRGQGFTWRRDVHAWV